MFIPEAVVKNKLNEALGVLGCLVGGFRTRQWWPENTQEAIRDGQMLPSGAHGVPKGGAKVLKRSQRGAQEVQRTTKERPRASNIAFER